jgi:hypothetical protein
VRRSQLALANALRERVKIYLDTNYWVDLRKADAGLGSASMVELLACLRDLVARGRAVCPLSESSFIELLNQTDAISPTVPKPSVSLISSTL